MIDVSQPISVGVIGVGGMGSTHAGNLHAKVIGTKVAAVMDVDRIRAEEVAARC